MALLLESSSSQRLERTSPPVIAMPFSVGAWVMPTGLGSTRRFWSLCNGGGTDEWSLGHASGNQWALFCSAGGSTSPINIGTATSGRWAFVLGRMISATNRRLSVLNFDGSIVTGQATTSRSPSPITREAIGCQNASTPAQFWAGSVAEYWIAAADVQGDNAVIQNALLWQLALGGPLSVRHVARFLVEYRSVRRHPVALDLAEDWWSKARPAWSNTNGVTVGPHVPLPYWYAKPSQYRMPLVV